MSDDYQVNLADRLGCSLQYDTARGFSRPCVTFDCTPLLWFDSHQDRERFHDGLAALLSAVEDRLRPLETLARPDTELGQVMLAALRGDVAAALAAADRIREGA